MKKILLLIPAVLLVFFLSTRGNSEFPFPLHFLNVSDAQEQRENPEVRNAANKALTIKPYKLDEVHKLLKDKSTNMRPEVIDRAMLVLKCAQKYNTERNNIFTVIDYSLPSSEKRLWVFDLSVPKILYYTYVSHGINSGALHTNYFSDKYNSKASSMGVYLTENSYYGRHGLSLKLRGLDAGFNGNAMKRYIVMHGSWYVRKDFIERYGRPGRSWGCPAFPMHLTRGIVDTIKDYSLLMIYYPNQAWFDKSRFLNCGIPRTKDLDISTKELVKEDENRGRIFFADRNNNNQRDEHEPVVTMNVNDYERIFNKRPPLKRMLRRQIDNVEYVALNNEEFNKLDTNKNNYLDQEDNAVLDNIYFIIPVVHIEKGRYKGTSMKIVSIGNVSKIRLNAGTYKLGNNMISTHKAERNGKSAVTLKSSKRFIRWLGL